MKPTNGNGVASSSSVAVEWCVLPMVFTTCVRTSMGCFECIELNAQHSCLHRSSDCSTTVTLASQRKMISRAYREHSIGYRYSFTIKVWPSILIVCLTQLKSSNAQETETSPAKRCAEVTNEKKLCWCPFSTSSFIHISLKTDALVLRKDVAWHKRTPAQHKQSKRIKK